MWLISEIDIWNFGMSKAKNKKKYKNKKEKDI